MNAEVVTIGTELLLGFTLDTNSAFLGRALGEAGVRITRRTTVPDEPEAVGAAVAEALRRSRLVITSGGLGPTRDDLSKAAVARLFDLPLVFDPAIWEAITARFARMGRKLSERNRCQAEVPHGATVLPNRRGTAPGLWISGSLGEVVMLPGVPEELRALVGAEVIPRLRARTGGRVVQSLALRTTGIAESTLAERLEPVEAGLAPLTLAYVPGFDGVDLRLTAWDLEPGQAEQRLGAAAERVRAQIPEHVYGTDEADLAAVVLDRFRGGGRTLAVAESCTGGLLGARITAVPGSSDVFAGGLIAYADRLKAELGVPARILEEYGAVSEEAARAMAEGARRKFAVSAAVAVTGIAGPGGGSPEKPVGLVWFALDDASGTETHRMVFPGARHEIRARAAQYALFRLWRRPAPGAPAPLAN